MKRHYRNTIRITALNNKNFDKLPYKGAKESLGFAIPKENQAYIRITPDYYENKDTIHHEIEELFKGNPQHEVEKGVFAKKWYQYIPGGQTIRNIIDPLVPESPGAGGGSLAALASLALAPFTGGASLAYAPLAGALGGALGAGLEGQNVLQGGLTGLGYGTLGSGIGGGIEGLLSGTGALPGAWNTIKSSYPYNWLSSLLGGGTISGESLSGATGTNVSPLGGELLYGGAAPNAFYASGASSIAPGSNLISQGGGGGGLLGGLNKALFGEGTNMSDILKTLTGGNKGFNWGSLIAPAISGIGLMSTSSPEMPQYNYSPELSTASQTYQDLLNQINPQELFSPIQDYLDLQKSEAIRNLRTQAAQQGYLDSTTYANQLSDLDKYFGTQGGLALSDLTKWGIGQGTDIASLLSQLGLGTTNIQYQAGLDRYNTDSALRQALLESLISGVSDIFTPNPLEGYLKNILGG